MSVAMENVMEWSGRTKNVGDDSGSLILGVNYSNYLQLISMLRDSTVTVMSLCSQWCWLLCAARKTHLKAGQLHRSLKLDLVLCSLSASASLSLVNSCNPLLCLPGIDERSGSGPWGPGQQNSPSFNQGRVRFL